ncbi:MAG: hypothetical protein ACLFU4_01145 [Opitutales bacterium]
MKYTEEDIRKMVRSSWANNAIEGVVATEEEFERVVQRLKRELIDEKMTVDQIIGRDRKKPESGPNQAATD